MPVFCSLSAEWLLWDLSLSISLGEGWGGIQICSSYLSIVLIQHSFLLILFVNFSIRYSAFT